MCHMFHMFHIWFIHLFGALRCFAMRATLTAWGAWGLGLAANGSAKLGPQTQHWHNEAWKVQVDATPHEINILRLSQMLNFYKITKSLPFCVQQSVTPASINGNENWKNVEKYEQLSRWDRSRSVESRAFSIAHVHPNMLAPGLSGINRAERVQNRLLFLHFQIFHPEMRVCSWLVHKWFINDS